MKTEIRELHVEGFGKLHERSYSLEGPMTLFYGPNEAGKSTLLAFLRAMLFGLPARASAAERHEPLRGGAHGGTLTLADGQGRAVRVERRFGGGADGSRGRSGASAGSVRVHGPEDGGASAAAVSGAAEGQLNALLGGLSADLFRSLFAFSLTELQELGTLQADELSGYLYSAGWGTSGRAILAVERRLALEAERLYRPRGKNQELILAIRAWEDEELGLRHSREGLAGYNRLAAELAAAEEDIARIDEELSEKRITLAWVSQLLQMEEPFRRWERIRLGLAELPAWAIFPVDAGKRHERAAARLEAGASLIGKLEWRRVGLARELDEELQVNGRLLADQARISGLLEHSGVYREQLASVGQLLAERGQLEQELSEEWARLGPDWHAERLAAVPVTVAFKERLRRWEEERLQLARRREVLQAELEGAERQEAAAERELGQRQARLARKRQEAAGRFAAWRELPGEELRVHMQLLRREQAEWARLHGTWQRLAAEAGHGREPGAAGGAARSAAPARTARASAPAARRASAAPRMRVARAGGGWRAGAWLLAALSAAVPAAVWAAGEPALAAGSLAALALAAGYAAYRARHDAAVRGPAAQELERLAQEGETLSGKIGRRLALLLTEAALAGANESAAALADRPSGPSRLPEQLDGGWLEQLELEADMRLTFHQELAHLEQAVDVGAAEWASHTRHREQALSRCQGVDARMDELDIKWRFWLREHGLPEDATPSGVTDILRAAERGAECRRRLDRAVVLYRTAQNAIDDFQLQVEQLSREYDDFLPLAEPSATRWDGIAVLKRLQAAVDDHKLKAVRKQQAEREMEGLLAELEAAHEDKRREQDQVDGLWRQAHAATLDQFLLHVKQHDEREGLAKELKDLDYLLLTLVGEQRLEEAQQTLRAVQASQLEEERLLYESALAQLQARQNELRDRRGRLLNEMDKLESGEDHADRMLQAQSAIAEVQRQARRWATVTLASSLFRTARERYETERQPAVLLAASRFFEAMTEGVYVRVTAPIGEKRLLAMDRDGRIIDSTALSRGTAEQLYLAMRFAIAAEYGQTAALPLIMDDVFVNFDPRRLEMIFRLLRDISDQHQVLLFTCHPHIAEAARAAIPELQVIPMT